MRAAVSAEIVDGGPHDRFATSKVRPEEPLADCEFPYIMPATEVGLAPLFRRSQTLPRRNARSLRHHGDQRSEQQGLLEVAILSESTFVCEQCKPDSLPLEECRDHWRPSGLPTHPAAIAGTYATCSRFSCYVIVCDHLSWPR